MNLGLKLFINFRTQKIFDNNPQTQTRSFESYTIDLASMNKNENP